MQVLFPERDVQSVGVTRGRHIGRRRAFPEHLKNGVARNKMDEQKDDRDN